MVGIERLTGGSMLNMPIVGLLDQARRLGASGQRVKVLWQHPDTLVFIARGREYRSEFHINPSDETMYMIQGEMRLHYRTPEGREEVAVIPEGALIYTPAGTPHSPRFPPDAFALISERKRREGEVDRFHWYCEKCDALLHEETFIVRDYAADPVSQAYQRFFGNEEFRTCKQCGAVMPAP
jgi:3-hydroxyanthranilate 3,4-dioxygenase